MNDLIALEIAKLRAAPLSELGRRFEELFGSTAPKGATQQSLWRKVAYRLQETAFGGLSGEARRAIAREVERLQPPTPDELKSERKARTKVKRKRRDSRIPMPGTTLHRDYKGKQHEVKVLEKGFEYGGRVYPSLSAIAQTITGSHWSGMLFFNL